MWSKEAFFPSKHHLLCTCSMAWSLMLSGGDFLSVKRLMKELTITLAECYQVMKYEFMLFAVLRLKWRKQRRQKEGYITPLATVFLFFFFLFLNPRGGMEEMSCTSDICWIPHRVNDIMQRFLNKFYPAWGEGGRWDLPPADNNTREGNRREDEVRLRAGSILLSNTSDWWVCAFMQQIFCNWKIISWGIKFPSDFFFL